MYNVMVHTLSQKESPFVRNISSFIIKEGP